MIRIGKLKVPEYKEKLARERLPSAKSERSRRYQKNKPKYGARSTNEVRNKANPYKIRRISSKLNEQVATPVVKKHIVEQAIDFDTESSSEKTMFMRKRSVAKPRESSLSSSSLCSQKSGTFPSESDSTDSSENERLALRVRRARKENMRLMGARVG